MQTYLATTYSGREYIVRCEDNYVVEVEPSFDVPDGWSPERDNFVNAVQTMTGENRDFGEVQGSMRNVGFKEISSE